MRQTLVFTPQISIANPLALSKTINLKKGLGILMFLTILSVLTVSIVQINAYTREFYLIGEYEDRLVQLEKESKILEINYSKANSLSHIGNYVQNDVFEKANKVEYIRLLEGTAMAK